MENGCIEKAGELLDLDRRCFLITDEKVPREYIETVAEQCREKHIFILPVGESSKSMGMLERILMSMLQAGFTRRDCVIAVGGGVPGDIGGFAAATYMRGIDFYNIPTTLLSQADSSIGGKTAVNLGGVKNIAGAFWQPRKVLIDPVTLNTLDERQIAAGMAEIVKAGLIADAELFRCVEENCKSEMDMAKVIEAALKVKKAVVEEDEREGDLRRILNFGHTIGHGIESVTGMLHGECVAMGMIPMCSAEVRRRLVRVLEPLGLPVSADCDSEAVFEAVMHDKKIVDGEVMAVYVSEPGTAKIVKLTAENIRDMIDSICHTA
ncbi:MAG: 3-dehydroquinate synthase [Mogibacterium sp.]|nr:3-dehydroquinate synthase [Mogibacterium sp.]